MAFKPTAEQDAGIKAFRTGDNIVIEAYAGTGKTTLLRLMAEDRPKWRGVYLAYNKAIADDAKKSMPRSVSSSTAHSLAFRAVGVRFKDRLNGPRVTARDAARILGIRESIEVRDDVFLSPNKLARLVLDGVLRYCYSADTEPQAKHIPFVQGAEQTMEAIREYCYPYLHKAWADAQNRNGQLRFQHDYYLKMWALSQPKLECDYVLFDEAQDANPVIAQIVGMQDAQIVCVGDRYQAIYSWRGAVDAMDMFSPDHRLAISQSFRFGPAVADAGNEWLSILGAPLPLRGFDQIDSKVTDIEQPKAVLCRTNAEAIAVALESQQNGRSVAIVGGTQEIKRMAEAAIELRAGRGTSHPELAAFKSWVDVKEYVEEDSGASDLKVFVRLIDSYGAEQVIAVADSVTPESRADVIVSTAHKAKGREWDSVKIASDFKEPVNEDAEEREMNNYVKSEMQLCYVAVTRAKRELDNSALRWVENWKGNGNEGTKSEDR